MADNPLGDLVISNAPGRSGKYLYLQKGSVLTALARFRDDEAVATFTAWCREASGSRLVWDGSGEEG